MAGERLTKLTILVSLSPNDNARGEQTTEVRLRLAGGWISYYRGAYTQQHQYEVPDPDDVKREYVKQAVDNLLALVKLDVQTRGLPYTVSASRDLGNDVNTGWPKIAFDLEATQYSQQLDLDFENRSSLPDGFTVLLRQATLQPIVLQAIRLPAGSYGAANGAIYVSAYQGNTQPFTYTWADDKTVIGSFREQLKAGKYTVIVADQDGVSATATYEVTSDAQLLVTVQQTESSLDLLVRGGVPPYTVEWDDDKTAGFARTGLAPGTYRATVRDDHGASQRLVATLLAGLCYFSQNPVRLALDAGPAYRLDPTLKPNLSFVAEVWVERAYLSGTYEQVGPQLEQPADANGRTVFDVQALLDAHVREHVPALEQGLAALATGLFKRFYLKSAERFGTPPVTAGLASAQVHVVLCGGLSPAEAEAGRWPAYQAAVRPFLTWEPDYQQVLPTQPAYLYYQHVADDGDVELRATVRHVAGTTAELPLTTLVGARRWEVYCLAVGPAALGLTGDEVAGYDVWLATAAGVLRSQVRHFVLERAYYPQQRFFIYSNSLGGANVLAALAPAKQTLEVVATEAQRPAYDPELGDVATLDRLGKPTLSVTTGPRRRAQVQADQELLYSRRVVLLSGGQYWPGRVAPATYTVRDESEGLASLAFDFVLVQQRHFSPRLPLVVTGVPVMPVAGGEGATP
ncbi:MAG: hypothetical protein ACRYF0_07830 [Janthinobacterium lividum]